MNDLSEPGRIYTHLHTLSLSTSSLLLSSLPFGMLVRRRAGHGRALEMSKQNMDYCCWV